VPLPHPAVRRRSDKETASVGAVEGQVEGSEPGG
jgi:hypothetical protein